MVLRGMKLVEMVEMKKTPLGTEFFCCFTFVWEESLFFGILLMIERLLLALSCYNGGTGL